MENLNITFETKCWENDWKLMARTNHIKQMIENCNCQFDNRVLYVNNVEKPEIVKEEISTLVNDGIIDELVFVDDYAKETLSFFDIDLDSFKGGYYYSISELVGIFRCKTKYLLHFSSDSYIPQKYSSFNWIEESIRLMENNPDIVVANPVWNEKFDEAKNEAFDKKADFWISQGFSDQCYLINVEVFKDKIYNYSHSFSERYPKYGGELFEKRVDAYLRCNDKKRATYEKASYISKNITKTQYIFEKVSQMFGWRTI